MSRWWSSSSSDGNYRLVSTPASLSLLQAHCPQFDAYNIYIYIAVHTSVSTIYSLLILHIVKLHIAIYWSIVGLDRFFGLLTIAKKNFQLNLMFCMKQIQKSNYVHFFVVVIQVVSSIVLVRHVLFAVATNNPWFCRYTATFVSRIAKMFPNFCFCRSVRDNRHTSSSHLHDLLMKLPRVVYIVN